MLISMDQVANVFVLAFVILTGHGCKVYDQLNNECIDI